ncbi:MAG TPA: hypothetical protein VHU91_04800 [Mycobacteriales bacterium]|jgi:membrane protein CcdC involved in cytochrome C biogenesis|nr:hypothetical protein [Mycobacteriales bacterium]
MTRDRGYNRLLRWGISRDSQAVPHLVGMLVTAVATVLITRVILAASDYPKVGGKTLHIAHVLWGGLLMVVAMMVLLSFVGPVVRPLAAVIAGVGFGLFIDEVGKFVTNRSDYFFRPAPAIMYVVIVLLVLSINAFHGRRGHHQAEYLAGAVDQAVAGVAGGFTDERRAAAERLLDRARDAVGTRETRALLDVIPEDPYELADPLQTVRRLKRRFFDRLLERRMVRIVAVVVLVVETTYVVQGLGVTLYHRLLTGMDADSPSTIGLLLGTAAAVVSGTLVVIGLVRLTTDASAAFGYFNHSLLVSLLITRVFQFEVQQFSTVAFVVTDLVLLAAVGGERSHLRWSSQRPKDA